MNGARMMTVAVALGASVFAVAATILVGPPFTAKGQEAKQFQYRVVDVLHETDVMQRVLNEYGSAGWELVAVSAGDLTSPRMIFKK